MFVPIVAIFSFITPKSAIGVPNCFLSFAYVFDLSKAACAIPKACEAIRILPPSRAFSAIITQFIEIIKDNKVLIKECKILLKECKC